MEYLPYLYTFMNATSLLQFVYNIVLPSFQNWEPVYQDLLAIKLSRVRVGSNDIIIPCSPGGFDALVNNASFRGQDILVFSIIILI
jgi:hypothetical protein